MRRAAGNSDEANLLLNLIEQSGNLGIWSRTLKAKSGLHQTVIDKCLKNLETTRAIKSVKSIKHPTRKIYLLQHIQPSTELTGGPWYNGADLDVEFISNILKLCKRLVHQAVRSFPLVLCSRSLFLTLTRRGGSSSVFIWRFC